MEDFSPRTAPADAVPPGAVIDTPDARAELRSSPVRRYLNAGAVVTRTDIIRPHDRGFLAAVLAPDTRAVSIAVNAVSSVAERISPGDHVDLISRKLGFGYVIRFRGNIRVAEAVESSGPPPNGWERMGALGS